MKIDKIVKNFKSIQKGELKPIKPLSVYGLDIIACKNLNKQFMGIKAIDNLTINIPQAQTTGLIGPNGSGKTTLMNILTGMLNRIAAKFAFATKSENVSNRTNSENIALHALFKMAD